MTGYVTDGAGTLWQLPAPVEWEMEYGVGTPCDSFLVRCPWSAAGLGSPETWVGFQAEHGGERVFTGVVDECAVSLTRRGCLLELSGRGMAALLLDNEALGRDYQLATLEDIVQNHVAPYGIETLAAAGLPHVERFRVDTGSSEWTVVDEFARRYGGVTPRFDRRGRLILSAWEDRTALVLDDGVPLTAAERRDKRYGVLSEVLVRDRYSGAVEAVVNENFSAQGGRARRVMTVPGRSAGQAMRDTGAFQLQESAREREELELTVALPFYAMPGELVRVARTGFAWNGTYRVARSAAGMDGDGYWTRLTLRPPENV